MNKHRIMLSFAVLLVFIAGLAGCPAKQPPQAELDTPGHHVFTGNKFLAAGKLNDAFREFERAKELDPKYAPAFVGLGLVASLRNDCEGGMDMMKKADRYMDGDDQKLEVCVGFIRLYTQCKEKLSSSWLDKCESKFDRAETINPDAAAPYYYMGIAYKQGYEFSDAARMFAKVLDLDKDFIKEADAEYAEMQKIERAMPGTVVGKKIALLPEITRADIAALFVEELRVDELFKNRTPKEFDNSYKDPEKKFVTENLVKVAPATDIADHVLKADIEAVMEVGIKGLQPFPDHTYKPYKVITRAQYAMMMEDILIKITGDEKIATKFIGDTSAFPDIRSDVAYYNAVRVVTTRGIMKAKDVATGEFDPLGVVSGADALIGIRVLKGELKKY